MLRHDSHGFAELESTLTDHGIPYQVYSGATLFWRYSDVFARAVEDPNCVVRVVLDNTILNPAL